MLIVSPRARTRLLAHDRKKHGDGLSFSHFPRGDTIRKYAKVYVKNIRFDRASQGDNLPFVNALHQHTT